jgi:4-carboxymuconolactone decarboxylase
MPGHPADERLPRLEPDELGPRQAALRAEITGGPRAADSGRSPVADERGRLLGPFNAMLFNPDVGGPMQALGAAIRYRTSLGDRRREIAILVVAASLDSAFERFAHEPLARAAGLSEETIAGIARGAGAVGLSGGDAVVHRAARALAEGGDLDDGQYAELRAEVGTTGCVELVALIGYYRMLALMLRVFRVPAPER